MLNIAVYELPSNICGPIMMQMESMFVTRTDDND